MKIKKSLYLCVIIPIEDSKTLTIKLPIVPSGFMI